MLAVRCKVYPVSISASDIGVVVPSQRSFKRQQAFVVRNDEARWQSYALGTPMLPMSQLPPPLPVSPPPVSPPPVWEFHDAEELQC